MASIAAAFANACLDAAIALLNGGTVELQDASDVEVATGTLNATALSGSSSGGVGTLNAITKDDACAGGGPITKAVFKTSGATALVEATCAESGGELTIDNDSPVAGVDVVFGTVTFTMAVTAL